MIVEQVILSAIAAAVYSFVFFAKAKAKDPEEPFNPFKLAATIVVGVIVGVIYSVMGVDFTQQDISTQLTAYAGTVAVLESIMKAIWRQYLSNQIS